MIVESKEKLESFLFLAQIHRKQFDERRRYEWKIIFTLLSFYVLAALFTLQDKVNPPSAWIVWLCFLILAIISSLFLAFLHAANFKNKEIAHRAEGAILDILNETGSKVNLFKEHTLWLSCKLFDKLKNSNQWSWLWQTVIIFLFALMSALVITAN